MTNATPQEAICLRDPCGHVLAGENEAPSCESGPVRLSATASLTLARFRSDDRRQTCLTGGIMTKAILTGMACVTLLASGSAYADATDAQKCAAASMIAQRAGGIMRRGATLDEFRL